MTSLLQRRLTSCLQHLMCSSCSAKNSQSCDTSSCNNLSASGVCS
jgi:hypothetical protein